MASIIGIAILAGGAIFFGTAMLDPARERVEQAEPVLTGAYELRLQSCRILEDDELPEGVRPPEVGQDRLFVRVELLYPGRDKSPPPETHRLQRVNGLPGPVLEPVHAEAEPQEDGMLVLLTYATDSSFEFATLVRDNKVRLERVVLE